MVYHVKGKIKYFCKKLFIIYTEQKTAKRGQNVKNSQNEQLGTRGVN